LLAKQLLTDTRLTVASVAMASGFQSLRRFNVALKERYRMTPTEFRKNQKKDPTQNSSEFSFRLSYRSPMDWKHFIAFLSRRAIPQVETVIGDAYFRTVRLIRQDTEYTGFLEVRNEPAQRMISVRLSDSLVPVCVTVLDRIKRLFDLEANPVAINKVLGPLAKAHPGLRVPGSFDGFEMAVRAVLGQQVSVIGARTLTGRLVVRFGSRINFPVESLGYLFPTAARMARATVDEIGQLGIIGKRAETIIALARAISRGDLILEPGNHVEGTLRQLRKIPGIGEWTAQYIAMRALSWPDAFLHTDLGVCKALGEKNPKTVLAMTEKWRPWRAYAVLHLWAQPEKKT
jgi:AraC family transcriptional regulator of adaptative response / DNA-3-methyladenine glycosylase II